MFGLNINNLEKTYVNINLMFERTMIKYQEKNIYRNYYFKNKNNQILLFKNESIKPTIVYLLLTLNRRFRQKIYPKASNIDDAIKSEFYPIYTFIKIINFLRCIKDFGKFYSDFIELYENLILLLIIL